MASKRWTRLTAMAVGVMIALTPAATGIARAESEGAEGNESAAAHRMHRRWDTEDRRARRIGGVFLTEARLEALAETLAEETGLAEDEVKEKIREAGRSFEDREGRGAWKSRTPRRGKGPWMGPNRGHRRGPGFRGHHGPMRGHHGPMRGHHGRMGPGSERGPHMGPGAMGRPGPGFFGGMADRGGDWLERISDEVMTPELEAAVERLQAAREEAGRAMREAAGAWRPLAEARWEVMGTWLDAAKEAGELSEERYERLKERHEVMKRTMTEVMDKWAEKISRDKEGE